MRGADDNEILERSEPQLGWKLACENCYSSSHIHISVPRSLCEILISDLQMGAVSYQFTINPLIEISFQGPANLHSARCLGF